MLILIFPLKVCYNPDIRKGGVPMKKWIHVLLTIAILLAVCLCPLPHVDSSSDYQHASGPAFAAGGDAYGIGAIESDAVKNGQQASKLSLSIVLLFLLLFVSSPRAKLKHFFRSAVPIRKRICLLAPVHFQSRYLSKLSVHL